MSQRWFGALQFVDTCKSEEEAQEALKFQLQQVDSIGGRAYYCEKDCCWKIQCFSEENPVPDDPAEEWFPDGVRRVLVREEDMKRFGITRNPHW